MNVLFTSLSVLSQHAGRYLHLSQQTPVVFQGLPSHAFISLVSHSAAATAVKSIEFLTAHENSSGGGVGALEWLAAQQLQQRTYPLPMFDDSETPDSQQQLQYADVAAMCSTGQLEVNISSLAAAAQEVLRVYMEHEQTLSSSAAATALTRGLYSDSQWATYSCVLYDDYVQRLWLISDAIGATPLWFGFRSSENASQTADVIVSSDIFLCNALDFTEVSPLGPHQILAIDLRSTEISSITDISAESTNRNHRYRRTELVDAYAGRLMSEVLMVVQEITSQRRVVAEWLLLDERSSSSLLLQCAVELLNLPHNVVSFAPYEGNHTIDHPLLLFLDTMYNDTVGEAMDRKKILSAWTECSSFSSSKSLSALTGMEHLENTSLQTSLKNVFCRLHNVTTLYPFTSTSVQEAINSFSYPRSALHTAADVIIRQEQSQSDEETCPSIPPPSDLQNAFGGSCVLPRSHRYYSWSISIDANSLATRTIISDDCSEGDRSFHNYSRHAIRYEDSLWYIAHRYANADKIIVLVLATEGYADMLINFLLSTIRLDFRHILVITADELICSVAARFEVGCFNQKQRNDYRQEAEHYDGSADFGTVHYQQLMLSRTECALHLLLMGFQPIIADIDTVWQSNPLIHLPSSYFRISKRNQSDVELNNQYLMQKVIMNPNDGVSTSNSGRYEKSKSSSEGGILSTTWQRVEQEPGRIYDIAITDDGGQVCGCFVAISNTDAAIYFWREVYRLHYKLVMKAKKKGELDKFNDSEQLILTDFLYRKKYQRGLKVWQLPNWFFPSGRDYFNTERYAGRWNRSLPAIIHNNFMVGKQCKKERFQRYGMWSDHIDDILRLIQQHDLNITDSAGSNFNELRTGRKWDSIFAATYQNTSIPSLSINIPVHNTHHQIQSLTLLMSIENMAASSRAAAAAPDAIQDSYLVLESDPPSEWQFFSVGVATININEELNASVFAPTVVLHTVKGQKYTVAVDIGCNRTHFGVDRGNRSYVAAYERGLLNQRIRWQSKYFHHNVSLYQNGRMDTIEREGAMNCTAPFIREIVNGSLRCSSTSHSKLNMSYLIKVITYNRATSLQRLLNSLNEANYGQYDKNVSLEIIIDGARSDEDAHAVRQVQLYASSFQWLHGPKLVTIRPQNMGLPKQWFLSWTPSSRSEAAFIFEDDIEASPYFFEYAVTAVEKYYANNVEQQQLHMELLEVIDQLYHTASLLETNGTAVDAVDIDELYSEFHQFVDRIAGLPLMYGVCLQRQHIAPKHHPQELEIKNGFQPFLFSLVGSWGPLMLPDTWNAFRKWWMSHDKLRRMKLIPPPYTEGLIINDYMRRNPYIWTPYHVRFGYETGAKCLYSNLPDQYTFAVNHRERGANYQIKMGPDAVLVTSEVLNRTGIALNNDIGSRVSSRPLVVANFNHKLQNALTTFPDIAELARWQYDFNVRRTTAFSAEAIILPEALFAIEHCNDRNTTTVELCHLLKLLQAVAALNHTTQSTQLSAYHWMNVMEMLERYITHGATVLHYLHTAAELVLLIDYRHYQQFWLGIENDHMLDLHEIFVEQLTRAMQEVLLHWHQSYDFRFNAPTMKSGRRTNESAAHALLVIDINSLKHRNSEIGTAGREMIIRSAPTEYILIVDENCAAAPTDLWISFSAMLAEDGTEEEVLRHYWAVDDVCSLTGSAEGAVLYKSSYECSANEAVRFDEKESTFIYNDTLRGGTQIPRCSDRFATMRQLAGKLTTRRTIYVPHHIRNTHF